MKELFAVAKFVPPEYFLFRSALFLVERGDLT